MKKDVIRSKFIYIVAVLLLLVSTAVALKINLQTAPGVGRSALVITGSSGGMCPNGPCGGDGLVVYEDGKLSNGKGLSSDDMNRLRTLVDQFEEMSYTTNGDCGNSIFDGSDPYLKFPQKYGERQFEPCGIPGNANSSESNQIGEILQIINAY